MASAAASVRFAVLVGCRCTAVSECDERDASLVALAFNASNEVGGRWAHCTYRQNCDYICMMHSAAAMTEIRTNVTTIQMMAVLQPMHTAQRLNSESPSSTHPTTHPSKLHNCKQAQSMLPHNSNIPSSLSLRTNCPATLSSSISGHEIVQTCHE